MSWAPEKGATRKNYYELDQKGSQILDQGQIVSDQTVIAASL